jgi:hypothetical protein
VPDALTEWRNSGLKTYIYSSGSRLAQRLLFGYCTAGDLRTYLHGFFDTTSGSKVGAQQGSAAAALALVGGTRRLQHRRVPLPLSRQPDRPRPLRGLRPPRTHHPPPHHPPPVAHSCAAPTPPTHPPTHHPSPRAVPQQPQVEAASYREIALSLGVDHPSEILFATDALAEAQAAQAAGWRAVLVERPGNKALPAGHGFRVVTSMQQLLQ